MSRPFCRPFVAILSLALMACSANHHSIFRNTPIRSDRSAIITVDAKQRAILVGENSTTDRAGSTKTARRFCSEASPDVFAVIAQGFSGGGSFGKNADPKAIEIALTAAFSSSEQGSTIPRTQTVNMLRELMFRTCERYLNGGINEFELPIQAARDQRLMVSVLAIEQLTGAIAAKPIVIGAIGSAQGGESRADALVRLDDAYKDLQTKTAAVKTRQDEYDAINVNGESKDCEIIAAAVAKKEESTLTEPLKAKRAKCESTASALAAAKKAASESATHHADLKTALESGGIPVAASTELMQPVASGGLDRAHSESVEKVADVVKDIVLENMHQDEFLFLCLKSLTENSPIKDTCINYINATIKLETARTTKATAQEMQKASDLRVAEQSGIEKIVDYVFRDTIPANQAKRRSDVVAGVQLDAVDLAKFNAASTKDELRTLLKSDDFINYSGSLAKNAHD